MLAQLLMRRGPRKASRTGGWGRDHRRHYIVIAPPADAFDIEAVLGPQSYIQHSLRAKSAIRFAYIAYCFLRSATVEGVPPFCSCVMKHDR